MCQATSDGVCAGYPQFSATGQCKYVSDRRWRGLIFERVDALYAARLAAKDEALTAKDQALAELRRRAALSG